MLKPGNVAYPVLTYALALFFMMRMIELLDLNWTDLDIAKDGSSVAVTLDKSKGDQESKGVKRTLGCTCRASPNFCPVEVAKKLKPACEARWGTTTSSSKKVVVTTEGRQATREEVLRAWSDAAGTPLQGHSARRSGALFYVRAGLSIPEITFLGRWSSSTQRKPGRTKRGHTQGPSAELRRPNQSRALPSQPGRWATRRPYSLQLACPVSWRCSSTGPSGSKPTAGPKWYT